MSREIVHADLTILAWIMRSPDAEALLKHVETHFAKSSGRLGYMLKGDALSGYLGGCEDLEHLVLMRDGLLTKSRPQQARPFRAGSGECLLRTFRSSC
jgi:hypothetical protein